ncbi:hypothetical protein Vretimale_18982, partial [Volvox reticuliferus]
PSPYPFPPPPDSPQSPPVHRVAAPNGVTHPHSPFTPESPTPAARHPDFSTSSPGGTLASPSLESANPQLLLEPVPAVQQTPGSPVGPVGLYPITPLPLHPPPPHRPAFRPAALASYGTSTGSHEDGDSGAHDAAEVNDKGSGGGSGNEGNQNNDASDGNGAGDSQWRDDEYLYGITSENGGGIGSKNQLPGRPPPRPHASTDPGSNLDPNPDSDSNVQIPDSPNFPFRPADPADRFPPPVPLHILAPTSPEEPAWPDPPYTPGRSPPSPGRAPPPYGNASVAFGGGMCADAQLTLDKINRLRALHQANPLRWSSDLAAAAQGYANTLAGIGCAAPLVHSSLGELLYWRTGSTWMCRYAVIDWYSEEGVYNFNTPTPFTDNVLKSNNDISHFTQLVWRASYLIGCGVQKGTIGFYSPCTFVVCRFSGPGNQKGDFVFLLNVLPPKTS